MIAGKTIFERVYFRSVDGGSTFHIIQLVPYRAVNVDIARKKSPLLIRPRLVRPIGHLPICVFLPFFALPIQPFQDDSGRSSQL